SRCRTSRCRPTAAHVMFPSHSAQRGPRRLGGQKGTGTFVQHPEGGSGTARGRLPKTVWMSLVVASGGHRRPDPHPRHFAPRGALGAKEVQRESAMPVLQKRGRLYGPPL